MKTYTMTFGRAAQPSFADVFDYVSRQPDAAIVAGENGNHRRFLKIMTDDRTMTHIKSFAADWHVQKNAAHNTSHRPLPY